jgi:hypothetical protein
MTAYFMSPLEFEIAGFFIGTYLGYPKIREVMPICSRGLLFVPMVVTIVDISYA